MTVWASEANISGQNPSKNISEYILYNSFFKERDSEDEDMMIICESKSPEHVRMRLCIQNNTGVTLRKTAQFNKNRSDVRQVRFIRCLQALDS